MNDRRLPLRPDSHQLEELSRRFFSRCLPKNWTWESLANDYGADLKVDLFEGQEATGLEVLVQLKSSSTAEGGDSEPMRLKTTTLNYLKDKLQVVMLVKFIESENEAYWLWLKDVNGPRDDGQETLIVRVPRQNRLSTIDWNQVQAHVRTVTDRKLAAQRAWQKQQARERASE